MGNLVGSDLRSWLGLCIVVAQYPDRFPCLPAGMCHVSGLNQFLPLPPSRFTNFLGQIFSRFQCLLTKGVHLGVFDVVFIHHLGVVRQALNVACARASGDVTP